MKNVLFIGPYRQTCGWGTAAKNYIYALIASGVNLTLRPIYMGPSIGDCPVEFLPYENNILPHYDAVIQNVLPHLLDYNSRLGKNIALCYTETRNWQNTWASRLNRMDEVWVPSRADLYNMLTSNVKTNITRIPIPMDTKKFLQTYESKELQELHNSESFIFYFIGEFIQRKCLDKLVQAFHIEFERNEPVELLIKTSKTNTDANSLAVQVNQYINRVKSILRIYSDVKKYKNELLITSRLSDNDLNALHYLCDCFVMPSMGESWSIPCMDALGFGKMPVVIDYTGPTDMVDEDNGWLVNSYLDNVLVLDPPLPDLYTGREVWHNYSVKDLSTKLREAYEYGKSGKRDKQDNGMESVQDLSYDKVAQEIKEAL